MSDELGAILGIIGFIVLIIIIVKIRKAIKHSRSVCPECKQEYSYPESFDIYIGDLKWRKETKEEYEGDIKYKIEYKQYYRRISIDLKCNSCGHTRSLDYNIDIWRSDDDYSYSESMDKMRIEDSIKSKFDKSLFEGKEINILI